MAVKSALGGAVRRREDPRLVTGAGQYTDDVRPAGCLHAVFVRSTLAHARVTNVDVAEAAALPGVIAVFRAGDLRIKPQEFPSLDAMSRPPLANDVVRFVGDAIAVVVAETLGQAIDAAVAVIVDYEPLPVVIDPAAALEAGSEVLHGAKGDNVASTISIGDDDDPLVGAELIVRGRFVNQRVVIVV